MLGSPIFHGSKRCKQFLEYICEKSLAGEAETLKERTIAVEVFGRPLHSDLGEDTIVRVGAREVRKRLAQYYVTPEGLAAEVHIDLLPGSYAPEFRYANTSPPAAAVLLVGEPHQSPRSHTRAVVAGAGILMAVVGTVAALAWTSTGGRDADFRRFWEPVISSSEPLLLTVANPIVYHPSARATRLSEENQPAQKLPIQRPIQVAADQLDGSDIIPVPNQYVGFGDMVVATEVAAMLGPKIKPRLRSAGDVQFADLRQEPTLLIGAITNRWTMELGQNWRFQFGRNPGLDTVIVDTTDTSRRWRVPSHQDGSAAEDYMLICRIRHSVTGGLVIVAAGVKQFGTEAAGRLITDPVQLSAVLGKLPRGWENRNLQIVLHARVIGNTPGQPEVVAWHVW
jgi:hypothetical protein